MPPLSLHSDEPTLLDQLGRGALVKEVGDVIAGCEPPQVLGIHFHVAASGPLAVRWAFPCVLR